MHSVYSDGFQRLFDEDSSGRFSMLLFRFLILRFRFTALDIYFAPIFRAQPDFFVLPYGCFKDGAEEVSDRNKMDPGG
jgi:hypothetical protein